MLQVRHEATYADFSELSLDYVKSLELKLLNNWLSDRDFKAGSEFEFNTGLYISDYPEQDLIDQSNSEIMAKLFEPYFGKGIVPITVGHWLYGSLDGYVIHVFNNEEASDITRYSIPFLVWSKAQWDISRYPLLDDEHHTELVERQCLRDIQDLGSRFVGEQAPDSWVRDVYDNIPEDFRHPDSIGETDVYKILEGLGWLEEE